jgi:glutamine---fructose-6-phosphate transaminase (isomerizing)
MKKITLMETEARQAPGKIALQLKNNEPKFRKIIKALGDKPLQFAITIGRGSSDHACTFAKYLFETQLGLVTASAAPSVVTIYNAKPHMKNALVVGISQSGKSPDICRMMEVAKRSGATTLAIINQAKSPLAKIAEFEIPIAVGPEKAVAATKSYLGSLTALVQFVALLTQENKLLSALKQLPKQLALALKEDHYGKIIADFLNIDRTFVIARGFGFPIAQEAALKFKETAGIQAEAFSAAEILHGPFALIRKDHPFLLFAQADETLPDILNISRRIKKLGGKSFLFIPRNLVQKDELKNIATQVLFLPKSLHPILDPIVAIQAFYPLVAKLAVARGFNPDVPQNLKKVTETF